MRLASISDLHINSFDNAGIDCFIKFCEHPMVKSASHIALMGDIFDLLVGDHRAYDDRWKIVWDRLFRLCGEGKIVYYAEGNHDMHLKKFLNRISDEWDCSKSNHLIHIKDYLVVTIDEKKVYLSHGDELNKEDEAYLRYKKFIKTPLWEFVANRIMPLRLLDYLGVKASKQSRKYGSKKFNEENVRQKFRVGIQEFKSLPVDVVIGGHSHVEDEYIYQGIKYLNNGYPPKSKKFIVVDSNGARLESLF